MIDQFSKSNEFNTNQDPSVSCQDIPGQQADIPPPEYPHVETLLRLGAAVDYCCPGGVIGR